LFCLAPAICFDRASHFFANAQSPLKFFNSHLIQYIKIMARGGKRVSVS
jgi:hypothetical protein